MSSQTCVSPSQFQKNPFKMNNFGRPLQGNPNWPPSSGGKKGNKGHMIPVPGPPGNMPPGNMPPGSMPPGNMPPDFNMPTGGPPPNWNTPNPNVSSWNFIIVLSGAMNEM